MKTLKFRMLPFIFMNLFFITGLIAQKPLATFFSEDGDNFTVIMDGKKINSTPMSRVEYVEMDHDWAKVKIIFEDKDLPPVDKTIQGLDADGKASSTTWVIKKSSKGKWKIVASSWKPIEEEKDAVRFTDNNDNVYIEESKPATAGEMRTSSTQTITTQTSQEADPSSVNVSAGINSFNMKVDIKDDDENAGININIALPNVGVTETESNTSTTITTTTTTTSVYSEEATAEIPVLEEKPVIEDVNVQGTNCNNPMSEERFLNAKNSIANKDFEDSKLTIAKQVMKSNCLKVSQIKQIMMLFDFEDTKVEFAKEAYDYTFDTNNYYELNDAFTFESSIDELNEHINK
ncbi:MAG: DUF4476 domain-containing protein [Bacteroidales bacterium]|nr:DUF4476 domain-containing protein [Bacteroidales bacterium]MCF8404197.1 DUF4476 domain-containing protein [Bacteroidales bacterium]